jgi:ABC-type glutathione transport system ATPase component
MSEPLLSVENLKVRFPGNTGGHLTAVDGVSFVLREAGHWALSANPAAARP